MKNIDISRISRAADGIRRRVLAHTVANNGGYLSQALSSAETFAVLYLHIMNLPLVAVPLMPKPFPGLPGRSADYETGALFNGGFVPGKDRFFMSPSHYALVAYAALIEVGRMKEEGLLEFNKDGSSVEMIGAEHSPGMEVTSGSLGQGLAQAAGIAHGRRLNGDSGMHWIFMSDGEFQSGMTWETLQAMSYYRLDNMAIFVDVNGQQCDGAVKNVMQLDPLEARIAAFGAKVIAVDGHDIAAIAAASETPHAGVPLVVLCHTDPCRGCDLFRRNAPKLHYLRFKSESEREEYRTLLAAWGGV